MFQFTTKQLERLASKAEKDQKKEQAKVKKVMSISPAFAFEPPHDKTSKMTCEPSEDSDQPGHLPSLIRVFVVHSMGS